MRDHDISQRRACRLVGVDPKTVRRERPPDCPEIRKEMQEIAGKRRRFGYRRIGVLLERKGMIMNHKKLYRLYREEGLSVKRRRGRKRPERLSNLRASSRARLSKPEPMIIKIKPADSRYERGTGRGQVTRTLVLPEKNVKVSCPHQLCRTIARE
jgi:hypothetical protein